MCSHDFPFCNFLPFTRTKTINFEWYTSPPIVGKLEVTVGCSRLPPTFAAVNVESCDFPQGGVIIVRRTKHPVPVPPGGCAFRNMYIPPGGSLEQFMVYSKLLCSPLARHGEVNRRIKQFGLHCWVRNECLCFCVCSSYCALW